MTPSPVFFTISPPVLLTAPASASNIDRRNVSAASSPRSDCRSVDPTRSQKRTVTVAVFGPVGSVDAAIRASLLSEVAGGELERSHDHVESTMHHRVSTTPERGTVVVVPGNLPTLAALARDDAVGLVYLATCAVLTCESPGRWRAKGPRIPDRTQSVQTPPGDATCAAHPRDLSVEGQPSSSFRTSGIGPSGPSMPISSAMARVASACSLASRPGPPRRGPWPSRGGSTRGTVGRPLARTARHWRRSGDRRRRPRPPPRRRRPDPGRWARPRWRAPS